MLFTFILVVQAIVAALLVSVILAQKSEGGGLGMGGGPSGFMSARGAADFLTRATTILASIFILLSITLAFLAATRHSASSIDTSLVGKTTSVVPPQGNAPANVPAGADPLAGAASNAATTGSGPVPLAH